MPLGVSLIRFQLLQANEKWEEVKGRLHNFMHTDKEIDDAFLAKAAPTNATPLVSALKTIKNPTEALRRVYDLIKRLIAEIESKWSPQDRYTLTRLMFHD